MRIDPDDTQFALWFGVLMPAMNPGAAVIAADDYVGKNDL